MKRKLDTPAWEQRLGSRPPLKEGGYSRELEGRVMQRVAAGPRPGRRRLIRWSPLLACGLMIAIGIGQAEQLAGWAGRLGGKEQADGSSLNGGKPFTLRVAADSAADFMAAYGEAFEQKYPNAQLEVIPLKGRGLTRTGAEQPWGDWFADQRPDVLELEADRTYSALAAEGRLQTLETLSQDEGWERGRMHPGVTAALRSLGGGALYGIAPEYEQLALYYNPSLFEQYGVPLPRDGMNRGQLIEAASRLAQAGGAGEERIYGLAFDGGLSFLEGLVQSAAAEDLGLLDPQGHVDLQDVEWRRLWEQAVEAARGGAVYVPGAAVRAAVSGKKAEPKSGEADVKKAAEARDAAGSSAVDRVAAPADGGESRTAGLSALELFLQGRAAMVLGPYDLARRLDEAARRAPDNKAAAGWNIVTEPQITPGQTNESASFRLRRVYAAAAESPQPEAALALVKYIAGEEAAKRRAAAAGEQHLPSRLPGLTLRLLQGKHAEAFYRLQPPQAQASAGLPSRLAEALPLLAAERFAAAAAGRQTADAALRQLEAELQAVLDGAK
ncbi:multiple sugar transport system substrate-binding protein [Paenibacillus mucilaginosus]|uniref:ABC transporter substrate-binding protein n=1 Tax=Paenibacillus mucilaginosus TaxID=61624 RepID=UPI003D1E3232